MRKLFFFTAFFFLFSSAAFTQWEHKGNDYNIIFPDGWATVTLSPPLFKSSGGPPGAIIMINIHSRDDMTFDMLRWSFTNDTENAFKKMMPPKVTDFTLHDLNSDSGKKSISVYFTVEAQGLKIKSRNEVIMGKENILYISCMVSEENFDEYTSDFTSIINSFKFDPGFEYTGE